jgi:hypothetical protein
MKRAIYTKTSKPLLPAEKPIKLISNFASPHILWEAMNSAWLDAVAPKFVCEVAFAEWTEDEHSFGRACTDQERGKSSQPLRSFWRAPFG